MTVSWSHLRAEMALLGLRPNGYALRSKDGPYLLLGAECCGREPSEALAKLLLRHGVPFMDLRHASPGAEPFVVVSASDFAKHITDYEAPDDEAPDDDC